MPDYPYANITLPTLDDEGIFNHRDYIEDFVIDLLLDSYGNSFTVRKYYKTANQDIYEDCNNQVASGAPIFLVRTRREDSEDANAEELVDNIFSRLEVIMACSVHLEKSHINISRYTYHMNGFLRKLLRENFVKGLPLNRRRPFIYLGNRDIYRDDDLDILLAEYNINYIAK